MKLAVFGGACENREQQPQRWLGQTMKLQINGEQKNFAGPLTLAALVQQLGLKPDRIAVELNLQIVARERWQQTDLKDADQLEIVHFVGGGISSL